MRWFLPQTAKQNKWGKMYLLPKVRLITAEEITQAERHSLKSLNKNVPGRSVVAQSESPTTLERSLMSFFSPSSNNKTDTYMGQPALHTTDRITPGFFWLHPNSVRLHFYDCTQMWSSMNWSKQSIGHFHGRSAAPDSRKQSWKHTQSSYWKSCSQITTSHLTTNFTIKLLELL